MTAQAPAVHAATCTLPWHCAWQTLPHMPQFLLSLLMSISQPSFSLLPLQSWKLTSHTPLHMPAWPQVGCEMWLPEHTLPQPPQLVGSLVISISQPFASLRSQLPQPPMHPPTTHVPARHSDIALASE